jgi:hypothetical protein
LLLPFLVLTTVRTPVRLQERLERRAARYHASQSAKRNALVQMQRGSIARHLVRQTDARVARLLERYVAVSRQYEKAIGDDEKIAVIRELERIRECGQKVGYQLSPVAGPRDGVSRLHVHPLGPSIRVEWDGDRWSSTTDMGTSAPPEWNATLARTEDPSQPTCGSCTGLR